MVDTSNETSLPHSHCSPLHTREMITTFTFPQTSSSAAQPPPPHAAPHEFHSPERSRDSICGPNRKPVGDRERERGFIQRHVHAHSSAPFRRTCQNHSERTMFGIIVCPESSGDRHYSNIAVVSYFVAPPPPPVPPNPPVYLVCVCCVQAVSSSAASISKSPRRPFCLHPPPPLEKPGSSSNAG